MEGATRHFEEAGVPLLLAGDTQVITLANAEARRLLGPGIVGRHAAALFQSAEHWPACLAAGEIETTLVTASLPLRAQVRVRQADGEILLTLVVHEVRDLLAGLHQILGAGGSPADLFHRLCPFLLDRLPYDRCSLAIWHPERKQFEFYSHHPETDGSRDENGGFREDPTTKVLLACRDHHEPVVRSDPEPEVRAALVRLTGMDIECGAFLPLHYQGKFLGTLNLARRDAGGFTARELELLRAALGPVALALEATLLIRNLQTSVGKYKDLYEEAPLMYHVVDSAGRIVDLNRREAEALGYAKEDLIGRPLHSLFTERSREEFAETLEQLRAERPTEIHAEREFLRRDGSILHASTSSIVAYDAEGAFAGARTIVRDITEQKQLQARLLQAQKLESLGTMMAGITHEFNNLLGPILGYAQMLSRRLKDQAPRELAEIEESAKKAAAILESLLRFTRQTKPQKKYQDLRPILANTLPLVQTRIKRNQVEVRIDAPEELPWTRVDETQMTQLFLNLLNNALDAIGPRPGRVQVALRQLGPWIQVLVRDTGGGIDEAVLPHLFDPFFTTKSPGKGTGLGLATCFGILAEHGGSIQASNSTLDGKPGACFEILFPVRRNPTQAVKRLPERQGELALDGRRVLVVEDDLRYNQLIAQLLESRGAQVRSAMDGQHAVEILSADSGGWDLVVCDVRMPRLGGRELMEWARQHQPALTRRFLFVTGDTLDDETAAFLRMPQVRAISKPFGVEELYVKVRELLPALGVPAR